MKVVKARTIGDLTAICSQSERRGAGGGTMEQIRGVNWGASRFQPIRDRKAKTRQDEENKPMGGNESFG